MCSVVAGPSKMHKMPLPKKNNFLFYFYNIKNMTSLNDENLGQAVKKGRFCKKEITSHKITPKIIIRLQI